MKILLSLVLSVTFFQFARASNYYFSAASGNDDRTPRQAQNPSTPWKTLSKLNAYFSSLQPGDQVLLKRGETFYGSISVSSSGTASAPIVIGAYGTGNKPVITSLVTLSGWTADNTYKGVYESSPVSSVSSNVNIVLLNGRVQQIGRYPNIDAANKGYLIFESHQGTASITDNELSSPVNWTGAQLVLRAKRWVIDRDLITSQSGNTIFYNASSRYQPQDKYGYFIQNDIRTLDQKGEWYFNPSSKQLSVFLGKNNSSAYSIQVSTIDNLISSSDNSHIVFDNLQIKGANVCGFLIKNGSDINIKNCSILFSGRDGIKVVNHKNLDIENCTVSNSNNNGIDLGSNGSGNATIRNNIIANTSTLPGMCGSGDGNGLAVQSNGSGSTIEYNEIRNTGYTAIYFNGDNVTVKNNLIDSFCTIKDDGGGIYTYTGTKNVSTQKSGRKIIGNIVINGTGAWEGTSPPAAYLAEGIYMDNNTAGVEISDNTVANCGNQGIFLQCAHEITVNNNTVFNSTRRQLVMIELPNHPLVRNCIITNNVFFSNQPSQAMLYLKSSVDDKNLFGTFENNYYAKPADDKTQSILDKIQLNEANAKITNFNNPARFEYNAAKENKTVALDGKYTDVKGNSYSNSLVLKPYSSIILVKQTGKNSFLR
jgi:parallel beta-helix repeat protein